MDDFASYALKVAPGLALFAALFWLLDRKSVEFRIMVLILGFILLRDAMSPLGFWQFGVTDSLVPWVRFTSDVFVLLGLGAASLLLILPVLKSSPDLGRLVKWGRFGFATLATGLAGAAVIAVPFLLLYQSLPLEARGGEVAAVLLPALLFITLAGNLLEEVIFRGFLQGYAEKLYGAGKAIAISALAFAASHTFLATTVTDLGPIIILFTLYEGLVCAMVRNREGVLASAIAHGLGIFVLASGI